MYGKFCKKMADILSIITGVLLVIVLLLAVSDIIFRNILSLSILIVDVFSQLAFVWMVFLGSTVVFYHSDHLKMDFFSGHFNPKMKKIMDYITLILGLILLVVMLFYGLKVVSIRMTIPFEAFKGIPTGYLYLSLPVAAFIMILFSFDLFHRVHITGTMEEVKIVDEEELKKQESEIKEGIEAFHSMGKKRR